MKIVAPSGIEYEEGNPPGKAPFMEQINPAYPGFGKYLVTRSLDPIERNPLSAAMPAKNYLANDYTAPYPKGYVVPEA